MFTVKVYPHHCAPVDPILLGIDCSKTKSLFSATYFVGENISFVGYGPTKNEAIKNLLDVVYKN